MIYRFIYDKETVVGFTVCLDFNRSILRIMALQILTQRSIDRWSEYGGSHSMLTFVKLTEYTVINIIIYHYNAMFRTTHKVTHQSIGIEYLPIKEDPLTRRDRSLDK